MVIVKHMRKMQNEEDTKRFINKFMNKHKHLNMLREFALYHVHL